MSPKTVAENFAEYREQLSNFIRKRVASPEDAEDILQDVFYQFVRMDSLGRLIENTSAWLYRVARNSILNLQHKKKAVQVSELEITDEANIFQDFAEVLFSTETTPETEYLSSLVWQEIETALAELPPEQREIFEQTELMDLPVKDIARTSGVPVNTLLSRKHYAVLHLRSRLKNLYAELMG
ncbi:RNA polymerase sigma-70 subunit ECF subfamily [Candidatus Termititenax dinenymphae]|uniref:RNA polymerase sigma-70 subunit ECF subfamily n=1 Tax=Candidatus Termititenax dinenymphae TaxID=2218523 RepID=A0A388TKA2_9BACT|nr:RNA polymerase sigma-70 subunit ECF subfamily [Candidatus Termititenax dinenymphae]